MKKPFRTLPYGTRFKMPEPLSDHMMVKIGHNLVADWPVALYNHRGEPIQSLCSWVVEDEEDPQAPTMETEVEVVE